MEEPTRPFMMINFDQFRWYENVNLQVLVGQSLIRPYFLHVFLPGMMSHDGLRGSAVFHLICRLLAIGQGKSEIGAVEKSPARIGGFTV
jgi:hypothetical protein